MDCLIAFLAAPRSISPLETLQPALTHMHRHGPDAEGTWNEPGIWLGHRQLVNLDLDVCANAGNWFAAIPSSRLSLT
jgi:hypothetical protein